MLFIFGFYRVPCALVVIKALRALEQPVDGRMAKSEYVKLSTFAFCGLRIAKEVTGFDSIDKISFYDIFVNSNPNLLAIRRENPHEI